ANSRVRGDAIGALAAFGPQITGTLSDVMLDESLPMRIRRQIPRVLKQIPNQRSVDVLLAAVGHQDLTLRAAILKGLNRLRETDSAFRAVSRNKHEDATAALEFLDNTLERDIKRILLPLLDAPEHLHEHGKELFGVEVLTAEDAIRELIRSHDPWLVACAMAAAAELGMRSLAGEIRQAGQEAQEEVLEVARSAEARLAA